MDRTIVHFEIPANNPEKLSEFYKNLFGWKVEKMSMGEMGDYYMFETREGTAQNSEKAQATAGTNGGMMKKMDANQRPVNYVLVESVDEFSKKIQQLGGKIVVPKTPIPNMGAFAIGLDPEGNQVGIFESS
ncbi:MAG TPA: VOC family protein [Candidatus Dormibacteraeota bacterium]|nr:VOC family protein [Candidatus Dormibacteraeota bacterium]